jgi:hypothetical protein
MKVLVATAQTQGMRVGDFTYCIEGELVTVGLICRKDRADPARGLCGCGRAFAGLNSHRATTTAIVKAVDITYDDYVEALRSSLAAQGWGIDDVVELAEVLTEVAESLAEGTVLGRTGDDLMIRLQPLAESEPDYPTWLPFANSG